MCSTRRTKSPSSTRSLTMYSCGQSGMVLANVHVCSSTKVRNAAGNITARGPAAAPPVSPCAQHGPAVLGTPNLLTEVKQYGGIRAVRHELRKGAVVERPLVVGESR